MNGAHTSLALEQAPPISVPFRFFLAAPVFLLAAGGLMLANGPELLASRWHPATLALVHLLTLGFLATSMAGALMQMLPVVAGAPIAFPRTVAGLVHLPLMAGTLWLARGLDRADAHDIRLAMAALTLACGVLLLACGHSLLHSPVRHATVRAMRLALLALTATAGIGIALAAVRVGMLNLALLPWTSLHAQWGLIGWVGVLVMGVSWQVIPMFQLTPAYPAAVTRWFGGVIYAALTLDSATPWLASAPAAWITTGTHGVLVTCLASYALVTLRLQAARRRKLPDVSLQFWRIGMASLLAAALLWLAGQVTSIGDDPRYPIALGMLYLAGFAISVVNGMLYKIVPFLVWFHLQSHPARRNTAPGMKLVIADSDSRRQLRLHTIALLLLFASLGWPVLAHVAGFTFVLSAGWLWWNLLQATRMYIRLAAGSPG